jgi:hypothetical protein
MSWDDLAIAADSVGMSLRKGNVSHHRFLHMADGWRAEVAFSASMDWYFLALPLAKGWALCREIELAHCGLVLARPAREGTDLRLLAEIPAAAPEVLAASLAVWRADVVQVANLIDADGDENVEPGPVPAVAPPGAEASRAVETFLQGMEADWQVTQSEPGTWRLVRRSDAWRRLPPVCRLSSSDTATSIKTTVPLNSARLADISVAARSHFLLRLNAGPHVKGRLLPDDGAELRAAIPTPGLQPAHLEAAYHAVVKAFQLSALELQALGKEIVAESYLRLQEVSPGATQ